MGEEGLHRRVAAEELLVEAAHQLGGAWGQQRKRALDRFDVETCHRDSFAMRIAG
jgi:hypothetical protein